MDEPATSQSLDRERYSDKSEHEVREEGWYLVHHEPERGAGAGGVWSLRRIRTELNWGGTGVDKADVVGAVA